MIPNNSQAIGLDLVNSTANTPAFDDNTTKIATMAAVQGAIAAIPGLSGPIFNSTLLERQTVDATTLQLTEDGLVQGAGNVLLIGANKSAHFLLSAGARDAANGDTAHWFGFGMVKRVADTMTLMHNLTWTASWAHRAAAANFAPTSSGTPDTAAQAWRLQLDVVGATGQLIVRGTGEAAKTIDWQALIFWSELP